LFDFIRHRPAGRLPLTLVFVLSGCATQVARPPDRTLPLTVGQGMGSQFGNYAATMDGEMVDQSGRRCVVWNWDRPLTADLVVRLRSASCESADHPGRMVAVELSRTIIPLSASSLMSEERAPDSADGRAAK
jgi:hypothetical protein